METAPAESLRIVFVELLDEGTTCFRPVIARPVSDGLFRILELPEYALIEETWSVEPGSLVSLETVRDSTGKDIPLARAATELEKLK